LSGTTRNVKFEDVLSLNNLLSLALLTALLFGNDLAGTLTVAARYGLLSDEARTNLAEDLLST
jgi:hypothetical protein